MHPLIDDICSKENVEPGIERPVRFRSFLQVRPLPLSVPAHRARRHALTFSDVGQPVQALYNDLVGRCRGEIESDVFAEVVEDLGKIVGRDDERGGVEGRGRKRSESEGEDARACSELQNAERSGGGERERGRVQDKSTSEEDAAAPGLVPVGVSGASAS